MYLSFDMAAGLNLYPRCRLLFCLLMVCGDAFGQTNSHKNVFAGRHLEYLEFRDDSVLITTLFGDWDTTAYLVKSDTLLIKKEHWQTDSTGDHHWVEWHPFKLLSRQTDTIRMVVPFKGVSKPTDGEDTIMFVGVENLKEPIQSFTYFNITDNSSWSGTIDISIDSAGRLVLFRKKWDNVHPGAKPTSQTTVRVLSKQEFGRFKNVLSYSLLSRLSRFRGGCDAMDAGRTSIEVIYNGKKIISKGCSMKWPYALLYNHVYDLANRAGEGFGAAGRRRK